MGVLLKPVFLVLARESVKGKGGTYVEEKGHASRSMEILEDGFVVLYTPVSTAS